MFPDFRKFVSKFRPPMTVGDSGPTDGFAESFSFLLAQITRAVSLPLQIPRPADEGVWVAGHQGLPIRRLDLTGLRHAAPSRLPVDRRVRAEPTTPKTGRTQTHLHRISEKVDRGQIPSIRATASGVFHSLLRRALQKINAVGSQMIGQRNNSGHLPTSNEWNPELRRSDKGNMNRYSFIPGRPVPPHQVFFSLGQDSRRSPTGLAGERRLAVCFTGKHECPVPPLFKWNALFGDSWCSEPWPMPSAGRARP